MISQSSDNNSGLPLQRRRGWHSVQYPRPQKTLPIQLGNDTVAGIAVMIF
jgi:hypothetical protein